jgi:hypothetical protein
VQCCLHLIEPVDVGAHANLLARVWVKDQGSGLTQIKLPPPRGWGSLLDLHDNFLQLKQWQFLVSIRNAEFAGRRLEIWPSH